MIIEGHLVEILRIHVKSVKEEIAFAQDENRNCGLEVLTNNFLLTVLSFLESFMGLRRV